MPWHGTDGRTTRRRFLQLTGGSLVAAATAGRTAAYTDTSLTETEGTVGALSFYSPGSQIAPDETELEDDDVALVRAEPTAFNFETEEGPVFVEYTDNAIPVVSEDTEDPVVGFGSAEFVADGNGGFDQDNEQFLVNLFDEKIAPDGEAVVAWDESHGQFWTLDSYESFSAYADDEGYDLRATDDLLGGASLTFPSTASQVAPSGEDPLTDPSHIVVWAEPTAENVDAEDDGAYIYDEEPIPLVSKSGPVVGFGTPELIEDGELTANNEQFVLNLLEKTVGESGTLVWDDAHDTFYDSSKFTEFADAIESEGYEFVSSGDDILTGESAEGTLEELEFFSTSSILDGDGEALTDGSRVAVWGEETAYTNAGEYRDEDDPVGEGPDIPLVGVDGGVVAVGSELAPDASDEDENRAFLVNAWEDRIGDTGTVLYDETHSQNLTLDGDFSQLESVATDRGFTVDAIESEFEDALDDADAVMVASDDDDLDAFTQSELDALDSFVADGGALFLHDTADFGGDSTDVLNDVLAAVGADLQFNSDQVEDDENSGFAPFVPRTGNFNEDEYPAFFAGGDDDDSGTIDAADVVAIPSPSASYTQDELGALDTHVDGGGAVFLFDESEFANEETDNLNDIADELGADFAFNPDQVEDDENNAGVAFVPTTANFNEGFDVFDGIGSVGFEDVDAVVVTSPSQAFSGDELAGLSDFVADDGAVFLFDQSDFGGFDETANLNDIADELDLDFRFNSDQINDEENNVGPEFDIATANYDDDRAVFEERENGIGIEFDRDEEYFGTIVRVFDGDTFEIEFDDSYGYREVIRHIGIDTAETGAAENEPEEWFGIPDDELDHLDTWGGEATDFSLDLMTPDGTDPGETDVDGRHVRVTFDEAEPLRGNFGRLLMYMYYDEDEFQPGFDDGQFDVNYNRETVEKGYARIYSSGFSKHDEWAIAEETALADRERVWGASDFAGLEEIRNEAVEDVFVPRPTAITADSGTLRDKDVVVYASDTAQRDGSDDSDIPLVAADKPAGVAVIGGLTIREEFDEDEDTDEFPKVTDEHQSFPLVTNLIEELSADIGPVLLEGGHGQFNAHGSISLERCQYFLRFLEGVGTRLRQVNDLPSTLPAEPIQPRAVVVTPPAEPYTQAELDALADFADAGGSVVLVGSARADDDRIGYLNDIAAALGTDLRLSTDPVTDPEHNLADDEELLVTSSFNETRFDVFDPVDLDGKHVSAHLRDVADDDNTITTSGLLEINRRRRKGIVDIDVFLAAVRLRNSGESVLPYGT